MVWNRLQIRILMAGMLAVAPACRAGSIILGGMEDTPGTSGVEKNGDFNDMIYELTGDITIDSPGGIYNNLTPSVVNQNGTVFWDNVSGDGTDMGVGYCLLDEARCSLAGNPLGSIQYLATQSGGSVNDVTFDATGPVVFQLLGGITADKKDTIGWYDLATPSVLHPLASISDTPGDTVSFTPDGEFALYATNGQGQFYSSVSADNVGESPDQQHLAFFVDPPAGDVVPEPSTGVLMGLGVALLGVGLLPRRKL